MSSISAELPPSNLIGALQFPQASFVVDPLSTLSSPTGLIDFSWDSDAPAGYSFSGLVSALVAWVRFDPRTPIAGFYTIVTRNESAAYDADTNGVAPGNVLEPGTLGLLPWG